MRSTAILAAATLFASSPVGAQPSLCPDANLVEVGSFRFFGQMAEVTFQLPVPTQESVLAAGCPGSVIYPPLPPGFEFATDVAFLAQASSRVPITSLASFSGPSAFVQLRNGNYGVVQDMVVTWNDSTPQDFTHVIFFFDIFATIGGSSRFLPQIVSSADPEGDFDELRILFGDPGPFTGQPVGVGFLQEDVSTNGLSDSFAECPLRGWSLAPLGILSQGQSRTVKIVLDLGVPAECTLTGTNVVTRPIDHATLEEPVTVTYDTVTQEGHTSLTISSQGSPPPTGFRLGTNPPTYYDISTTALFTGNVEVCIDYSSLSVPGNEGNLRLLHTSDGGVTWTDTTTSLDEANDTICGDTTSFSIFVIAELIDPPGLINLLIGDVASLNLKQGIQNSMDAKLNAAMQALIDISANNNGAAINTLNAFISAVQAQSGNMISAADASELIADAQHIISLLTP